jgi:hypothetical protein
MTTVRKPAGEPTLFITKDKHRVKQHGNQTVYLKNGEEFELELFNPTSKKVLAQITLNETSLGNGIILRPGERVFLERYLDDAKKFIFGTYTVDKNNKQVLDAIQNNGKVSVRFYEELQNNIVWVNNNSGPVWYHDQVTPGAPDWSQPIITCDGTSTGTINTFNCCTDTVNMDLKGENITYTAGVDVNISMDMATLDMAPIVDERETGRIEKGSHSNQEFDYDGTPFNSYPSWTDEWHILPFSEKLYTAKEAACLHCTECGCKRKKTSHKFCPHCGTKY